MYSKPNASWPHFQRSIPAYIVFFIRPAGPTAARTSEFFGSSIPQNPKIPQFDVMSKPTCAQPPWPWILPNCVSMPNCCPIECPV